MNLGINNNYNPAFTARVEFNYDGGKTQKVLGQKLQKS
jgi:hypothetical protein